MRSAVKKRSIHIVGHKTSVSMEDQFWDALKLIVERRKSTLADVIAEIDSARAGGNANLSSAVRLFVLADAQDRVAQLLRMGPISPTAEQIDAAVAKMEADRQARARA